MRAVVQRVSRGSVSIEGKAVAQIGRGVVILIGVGQGDTEADAAWLADKIAFMRLFEDEAGKTNLSALDVKGEAIVVSQFTLYADTSRGRRSSKRASQHDGEERDQYRSRFQATPPVGLQDCYLANTVEPRL